MKTQIRLSLPRTRNALLMKNRMTGTFYDRHIEGWYCGGRRLIHVEIGRGGRVKQTAMGCETEAFNDGFGVKIDTEINGEKPIVRVKNWRDYCHEVQCCYKPNVPWTFMGVAINWLQPKESGALHAMDQSGHTLYIHASDEALIDD